MFTRITICLVTLLATGSVCLSAASQIAHESTLHAFQGLDGAGGGAIIQALDGNFYGISSAGAGTCENESCGTIYRLTPSGDLTLLHTFSGVTDGSTPVSLIQGGDGNLYGATAFGGPGQCYHEVTDTSSEHATDIIDGCGTIFKITLSGTFTTLYDFTGDSDGSYPIGMVQGEDGYFYGTTLGLGGSFGPSKYGSIFRFDGSTLTPLYLFQGLSDGSYPYALVQGSDGLFYGATQLSTELVNGINDYAYGTIFSVSNTGLLTTLHSFSGRSDGAELRKGSHPDIVVREPGTGKKNGTPPGYYIVAKALAEGADGRLYGVTPGANDRANIENIHFTGPSTVFAIDTSGSLTTLHTFPIDGGVGSNVSLFLASDGNFYGTSSDLFSSSSADDEIFSISPSGTFASVYTFTGDVDGGSPDSFVGAASGALVGPTENGGNGDGSGSGTVDAVTFYPPLLPPVQLTLSSSTIDLGSDVGLSWQVVNGFSTTLQQCYAFVQNAASGAGAWSGLQHGSVSHTGYSGSATLTPTRPGTYTYALTCGGNESGFVTLAVASQLSLPDGQVGTSYSTSIKTPVGVAPFTYGVADGSLPAGLALSATGVFTGTPVQSGVYSFTIRSTDSEKSPISQTGKYALTIHPPAHPISPVIEWSPASSIIVGDALGSKQLDATASVLGTFVYSPAVGTKLSVGTHPLSVTFTPADTADYAIAKATSSIDVLTAGLEFVPVTPCRMVDTRGPAGPFGAPALGAGSSREFDLPFGACGTPANAVAYSLNVTVVPFKILQYLTLWPSGQAQPNVSTLNSYDGRIKANAAIVPAGKNGGVNVFTSDSSQVILDIDGYFVPATTTSALAFYPLAPCRVADTRGTAAPLGGPFLAAKASRSFPVRSSACKIPANAEAYSLNVTAVPHKTLNYLTSWPTGEAQPNVSTLNAPTGAVTANAAIVPAGTSGAISLFVSDDADVILDVDGYFAPPATDGLALYTAAPCRVVDTRGGAGIFDGVLQVPVETSACALPAAAQAYVLNATVVPPGPLVYLTLWPDSQTQPYVSTLNADDTAITSNLAIVPTTNGQVDAFSSNPTNLILDISSYFAP